MKKIFIVEQQAFDLDGYKRWKRKNVTLRGLKNPGTATTTNNESGADRFGRGLYTAALSNRHLAKQYGKVYFVVGAIPKNPKVFQYANNAEIFVQQIVTDFCEKHNVERSNRFFEENTSIAEEMIKMGYDGLIIKGDQMVNYTPPDDVIYFEKEYQLENHYMFLKSIGEV